MTLSIRDVITLLARLACQEERYPNREPEAQS
jgi:hypothetical protein